MLRQDEFPLRLPDEERAYQGYRGKKDDTAENSQVGLSRIDDGALGDNREGTVAFKYRPADAGKHGDPEITVAVMEAHRNPDVARGIHLSYEAGKEWPETRGYGEEGEENEEDHLPSAEDKAEKG